ncbi:MAG: hypothetical protein HKN16_01210 [Saprospiraceae bacterium]|nr:hypothetical protein [Saprospiraceae bacterium]
MKGMKAHSTLWLFFSFLISIHCQTVGTLTFEEGTQDGYTFFSPFSGTKSYMVDNCGRLVNSWERGSLPGLSAYFLEDGLMLRTYKVGPLGPFNSASNAGGLELVDWDNQVVWSYEINTSTWLSHHDAVRMPNGNLLVLTWEIISDIDLIELGRDPGEIAPQGYAWNERIIELEPIGTNEIQIVWEWRVKDHYIQDFDPSKQNFGVVSEHPELFDINLPDIKSSNSHSDFDYNHFNSIDYNPSLDQILISVRNSDEIWILDHSTTTQEATTHSGGMYGRGGDILYRYGNANAYGRGPVSDQKLFGQHGAHWIKEGLADEGKILVYNNGNGRPGTDYSEAEILVPPQNPDGSYPVPDTDPFGPSEPFWQYGNLGAQFFYSPFLSNAQRLPNGNTLINAGSTGRIFEINELEEIVWQYEVPLNADNPVSQGNNANNNGVFRAYKYPHDYPGFNNVDLSPGDLLQIDLNPPDCSPVNTQNPGELSFSLFWNSEANSLEILNDTGETISTSIIDVFGQIIMEFKAPPGRSSSQFTPQVPGIWFFLSQGKEGIGLSGKFFAGPFLN